MSASRYLAVSLPAVEVVPGLTATHREGAVVIRQQWETVPDDVFSDGAYRALVTLLTSRTHLIGSADEVLDLLGERAALDGITATSEDTRPWSPVSSHSWRARHIAGRARRRGLREDPDIKEVAEAYRDRLAQGK